MIQYIRVDDRLLHGQIVSSWRGSLHFDAIVLVSEVASNDPLRKAALKLAKPDGILMAIKNTEEAIELLNNPLLKSKKVFVITDTIKAASKVIRNIEDSVVLNIGGIQKDENKKPIVSFAYIDENDKALLDQLDDEGYEIEFRLVPTDQKIKYSDVK
ncbi:PTS sugar transporter subunit IIB [Allofustis seminis]|uniref:PTS sugar transporter subunit IIB n=1 Tax=Allofustis seminis TaxID=166939 RepID=UPI00036BF19E|nr:PTS sugar transporter subunit IIB [Allofustis seminis]